MKKTTLLQPKGWSTYFEIRADTAVHRCFTKCRKKHLGKFPVEHLWQGSMENTCKARSTTSVSPIFFRNFQNSYFNERPRMATSLWDIWILYLNCLKVKIVLLDLAFDCLIVVSLFLIHPRRKISQNTGFPWSAYSREQKAATGATEAVL